MLKLKNVFKKQNIITQTQIKLIPFDLFPHANNIFEHIFFPENYPPAIQLSAKSGNHVNTDTLRIMSSNNTNIPFHNLVIPKGFENA